MSLTTLNSWWQATIWGSSILLLSSISQGASYPWATLRMWWQAVIWGLTSHLLCNMLLNRHATQILSVYLPPSLSSLFLSLSPSFCLFLSLPLSVSLVCGVCLVHAGTLSSKDRTPGQDLGTNGLPAKQA
jgi:hypothetical protein